MRDRLQVSGGAAPGAGGPGPAPALDPMSEAVSALIALGLKPQEASRRVSALDTQGLPPEEIVRLALKAMA